VRRAAAFWLLLALLVAACAPGGGTPSPATDASPSNRPAGPKRILAAVISDLPTARSQLNRASGGTLPGARELEQLIHAGLTVEDSSGNLRPQLAEAAPTVENGLWRVFPDGRMETTWKIRPNAMWHDRTPFTAEDLLFTSRVAQDKDIGLFGQLAYESIESVAATDPRTITVRWSRPFIEADTMFSGVGNFQAVPLPRHLLEPQFVENKAALLNVPYWSNEYIGAGPFKIRDWVQGSHVSLEAFDGYVLGRPKVDEIEVKFIPDPTTLVANILAGAVELPIGRGLSLDQTLEVRDRWQEGTVAFGPGGAIKVWPQLRYAQLPRIADVQFRRALYHGMDRQQMADTLMGGLSDVAHSVLIPTDREFAALDPAVVRYDYDPRRSVAMLEEIGLTRGADGVFQEPNGQRMSVEVRATVIDIFH
jgi:peptide/nickel transport system substrate-binding protein